MYGTDVAELFQLGICTKNPGERKEAMDMVEYHLCGWMFCTMLPSCLYCLIVFIKVGKEMLDAEKVQCFGNLKYNTLNGSQVNTGERTGQERMKLANWFVRVGLRPLLEREAFLAGAEQSTVFGLSERGSTKEGPPVFGWHHMESPAHKARMPKVPQSVIAY